jgi:DNA-directed RNA polymerase subunit H (RpoH/RPB5)
MHVLQPKHEKMTAEEVNTLLAELNIGLSQLPKISKKDAALPVDCKTGDVVKISRSQETYYRVVI